MNAVAFYPKIRQTKAISKKGRYFTMDERKNNDTIQLFEDKKIRTAWDEEKEEWYFAIVDVIAILTDSPNPQTYWRVMKKRLKDEGNETVTNCNAQSEDKPGLEHHS